LYQGDASESVVYDRSSNSRIPRVVVDKMESMAAYKGSAASDYVVGANHRFGRISLAVVGNPTIVRLQDSLGRPVFNNSERIGDSLILTYLEGNPIQATLNTGALVFIPKLTAAQLPPPIYRHVDTTLISPIWPDTTATGFYGKGDGKARVRFNVDLTVPVFKSKGEQLVMLKQWEVGAFYGIGWYMGDLVPWYYPLPISLEYSKALFANYHWNNRLTLKTSLYNTTISFHNVMSPALFSRGFIPFGFDANGDRVDALRAGATTHDVMFITPMYMIDEELKWNLRSNMIKEGKKARLVPSLGLGLGLMHYTPYRLFYYRGPFYGQETFNEFKRDVYKYKINLRKAGTEGQNFLPGSKRYSPFTTNLSASFGLNYNRRKWSWIGEVRANVTHSDYLDDFGNGLWYGGDYERFLAAFPNEIITEIPDATTALGDVNWIKAEAFRSLNPELAPHSPRNGNVANSPWPFKNDGYLQFHMGIAYHLY